MRVFGATLLVLLLSVGASAQVGTIDAGTTIGVRTTEEISTSEAEGRVFSGVVDQDVLNRRGAVAIPKGSDVELVVRRTTDDELAVDLDSVTVNGLRYGLDTDSSVVTAERKDGIGANKRTAKYIGGGALIGAVIGAISGGGKGAAIGAGAGAAAGAGAQVLTRGKSVRVPAESLLSFRLQQPLQSTAAARRSSNVYYQNESPAYRAGVLAGRSDADRDLPKNARTTRWTNTQDRRDYVAGYNRGYDEGFGYEQAVDFGVRVDRDNYVRWQAPEIARVWVQVDNEPMKLFAEGQAGTQQAPWIEAGHTYLFVLRDLNGNEIGRDRLDTRSRNTFRRPRF